MPARPVPKNFLPFFFIIYGQIAVNWEFFLIYVEINSQNIAAIINSLFTYLLSSLE